MGILKYLMDSYYCLTSGKGVCWKGQSLETLKQTVPQQLLKSMEIYLTSAEGGWKVLEKVVTVQEQSYFFGQASPHFILWALLRVRQGLHSPEVGVWGCRGRAGHSQGCPVPGMCARVGQCPWPQTACCSHISACDPAGKNTRTQHTNVDGNSEVQTTVEQKTSSPTLGRKPGVFE